MPKRVQDDTETGPEVFKCPVCGGITRLPADVANRYCPCCGGPSLPKYCPHTLEAVNRLMTSAAREGR